MNVLVTPVSISEAYDPRSKNPKPKAEDFAAIWDTGATGSVITKKVVEALKLKPIGKGQSKGVHGGIEIVNAYLVNIGLPNKVEVMGLRVTECESLIGPFDVLIGMDIIKSGDFALTSSDDKTTMSFRMPSVEKIDFVKAPRLTRQQRRKMARDREKKGLGGPKLFKLD